MPEPMTEPMTDTDDPRDLVLCLTLAAPRDKIWRCLVEAPLLRQWFAPAPWHVAAADIDVRPGGRMQIVMQGPDGEESKVPGVYLEVDAPSRLVFSDAFTEGWRPAESPFMTAVLTLDANADGSTTYTARVRHWKVEQKETHAEMGFEPGWTQCARQLEALAQTL